MQTNAMLEACKMIISILYCNYHGSVAIMSQKKGQQLTYVTDGDGVRDKTQRKRWLLLRCVRCVDGNRPLCLLSILCSRVCKQM